MDNSDACHFKKFLPETKQNGSYRTSFLPTVLPNWCSPCTTFGISIMYTPGSRPWENITSVMFSYGLHLCQLAQELRRMNQGTVHRKQPVAYGVVSWSGVRTRIFGKDPVASKDAWNTTDHSVTQKHHIQEEKVFVMHGREELDLQQCQDVAVWQNQTLLLYSVHYCNIYVSPSLLMSIWCWGREGGRSKNYCIDSYITLCTYHCMYYYQSSKSAVWITSLCAIVAPQTIFSFLPLSHTQASGDKC